MFPTRNHIARYCKGSTLIEGRITGASFLPRETESYLSVNWLEYLDLPSREAEIDELRRVLGAKIRLGATAKLAVVNVGEMREQVRQGSPDARILSVTHEPEQNDPSHSGIYGLTHEDMIVAKLIVESIRETYPARA